MRKLGLYKGYKLYENENPKGQSKNALKESKSVLVFLPNEEEPKIGSHICEASNQKAAEDFIDGQSKDRSQKQSMKERMVFAKELSCSGKIGHGMSFATKAEFARTVQQKQTGER